MNVLFLSPIGGMGGAEQVLLNAIAGLKETCPDINSHVIALADGPLINEATRRGATCSVVPLPADLQKVGESASKSRAKWTDRRLLSTAVQLPNFLRRLREAVRRARPDIVHSNGIKTHLLSRLAVSRSTPIVWHLHDFVGNRQRSAKLLRSVSKRVAGAVAISKAVADDAQAQLSNLSIHTILNAVDVARFTPGDGVDLDRLAGQCPPTSPVVRVGMVATYARWKGHLVLLEAARLFREANPHLPVRWYIVGGPIYHTAAQFTHDELRSAIREKGLDGHVSLVPFQKDTVAAYRSLDVVIHASTQPEPFGLVIAEAMSCGRAVIVSNAGGASELVRHEHDALAMPPNDPVTLAQHVNRLVEQPTIRSFLGTNARATATSRFQLHQFGSSLGQLYRSLSS